MPEARRRNITLRNNEDFELGLGFFEPALNADDQGGRVVDDLVIENGSTTATSDAANFTSDDTGRKLAVVDGVGVADGTTMTYVDASTVTLSAAATADRSGIAAVIRALNCSSYTTVGAQVKYVHDLTAAPVLELTVDDSRNAVGLFVLSATQADIDASLSKNGYWDWLVSSGGAPIVWYEGRAIFHAGVTSP